MEIVWPLFVFFRRFLNGEIEPTPMNFLEFIRIATTVNTPPTMINKPRLLDYIKRGFIVFISVAALIWIVDQEFEWDFSEMLGMSGDFSEMPDIPDIPDIPEMLDFSEMLGMSRDFSEMLGMSDDILLLGFWALCLYCGVLLVGKLKGMWSLNFFQPVENRQSMNEDATASTPSTPNLYDDNGTFMHGRKIGKLIVTDNLIGKGSHGTSVLEGEYDGRTVAVKRILQSHLNFADREKSNLIVSDRHPNIIRLYGVECDPNFVYLCLERCTCNLFDLITCCASYQGITSAQSRESLDKIRSKMQLVRNLGSDQELELWNNDLPSALLLQLMREVACGLEYLHHHGITHRDLKPQNILLNKDRSISSKICDMGISKRLDGDMPSLSNHSTGLGSSGWQAPEQIRNETQTCAVDLFTLGCMYYFCLTRGEHPFGRSFDRDYNISHAQKDLSSIDHLPEAKDLISRLLNHNPNMRPNATEVKHHPLFWNSDLRISFLSDVSDRLEKEGSKRSTLLKAFEGRAEHVLDGKSWNKKMDKDLIKDILRFRPYKYKSLQDLVRVIRNKKNHPSDHILGPIPEGFYSYFSTRFPKLLIEVYHVICDHCSSEEQFHKYFN